MEDHSQAIEGIASSNAGFENASALQIRLDSNPIIDKIEYFLRGLEPNNIWDKEAKIFKPVLQKMGKPKANSEGIQTLLNFCRALINPQVVQGNYKEKQYLSFIIEKRVELASMLFINYYEWELPYENCIAEITDFIMNMVEPFLSRTINNQERLSYAQTIRTNETNTLKGSQGFDIFGGGKKE